MNLTSPENLNQAIQIYAESLPESQRKKKITNLQPALKNLAIPSLGFQQKPHEKLEHYFSKVSLKLFANQLKNAWETAARKALEAGIKDGTLKNYRSSLFQFLDWLSSQDWYQEVVQPIDIPKYAPRLRKLGVDRHKRARGRKQAGANPYGLKKHELTPLLQEQLGFLFAYLTNEWVRKQKGDKKIKEVTWEGYLENILWFLGWFKNFMKFDISDLDITLMAEPSILNEYIEWHFIVKGNGYSQARQAAISALNIAKWKNHKKSKLGKFADCPEVLKIQEIISQLNVKTDRRTSSAEALEEKLLTLEQCQEVVEHLRCCCAERTFDGSKRPINAIIDSWQDYMIVAILTYTPVRQSEIRQLQIDKNLRRNEDGWWVKLEPADHKTGSSTGKNREYPLFPCHLKERLTKHLDLYVNKWRPLANLAHNYLFFLPGSAKNPEVRGMPIPDSNPLSQSIPTLIFNCSAYLFGDDAAKDPSPHDFRRIYATWVCKYGSPEEIAIAAEIMGHSVAVLLATYQQCTSRDKTEQAEAVFLRVRERASQMKAQKSQKTIERQVPSIEISPLFLAILTPKQKQQLIDQGLL